MLLEKEDIRVLNQQNKVDGKANGKVKQLFFVYAENHSPHVYVIKENTNKTP